MKYNITVQRIFLWLMMLGIMASCNRYNIENYAPVELTQEGHDFSDYIVVHRGDEVWRIQDAVIEDNKISGTLVPVDSYQEDFYAQAVENETNGIYEQTGNYKEQTHIYVDEFTEINGDEVVIDMNDIKDANALVKVNKDGKTFWVVFTGVLIVLGCLIVGMGLFLLIVCNCPHAYTFDGKTYRFTNTLFTGATAANLERNDYKLLPDYNPAVSTYEMIIKNEENESHYTNLLELIVVNHSKDVVIVPDQSGNIYSISKLEWAKTIVNENGMDLSIQASNDDDMGYTFDSESSENMINTYATFEKPEDVSNAKVVLKLKNTEWGGIVYKTFGNMMGDKYDSWVEKNHKRTTDEALDGMKRSGIPLEVAIKKDGEWKVLEDINLVGEVSYNTLAIPIDESLITGENIEIRLKAGFKFWDLDYIAMDFSQKADFNIEVVKPTIANGKESDLAKLEVDDNLYMEHIAKGDSTYIKFENLNTKAEKRTIIMHSKGYYISNEVYEGNPYWRELVKLRAPGGLSKLSKDLYSAFFDEYDVALIGAN